jgi:peptidoglycan/xylan/chitin deacetylase (PgdA/CDA1 family)
LTFDAGGDPAGLPSIVATLRQTGTPATFFLTGSWIRAFPDQAREVARLGMPLGNHSDTHPHLPALTNAQIATELTTAEDSLRAVTGREFDPLFRFPFGDTTPLDIAVVNDQGYVCVRWTADTLGWKGTSEGMDAAAVLDRVVQAATPGEIVLMHVGANPDDGSTLDADALPSVIRELRALGYRFVTLHALLQTPGTTPRPAGRSTSWTAGTAEGRRHGHESPRAATSQQAHTEPAARTARHPDSGDARPVPLGVPPRPQAAKWGTRSRTTVLVRRQA